MADEPHDDADASQPGDPESHPDGGELSDEHEAVATGFEVDDGEPQDFDADTSEYDAAPDEADPGDIDDELEGDDSAEEFVLEEESPEEPAPEAEQPAEADDLEDEFPAEPADDADAYDGGGPTDEEPTEALQEDADQSQLDDEPTEKADEVDFSDESSELDDEAAASDLGEEAPDEEVLAAESSADSDDGEVAEEASEEDDADEFPLQTELDSILDAPEPESVDVEPLPEVGPYRDPATLTLWVAGDEHETFAVAQDELVIGDEPSAEAEQGEAQTDFAPDIDLGPYVDSDAVWGRHAALYRHNKNYTLYAISDGATQINDEVLEFGEHRRLEDGDVVVVGGEVGLEFNLPEARDVAGQSHAPESDVELDEESSPDSVDDEPEIELDDAEEAELVDEQPDTDPEPADADDLPEETPPPPDATPPPPDESGGFDDEAADTPDDGDAAPDEEWDDDPIEDEDDFA